MENVTPIQTDQFANLFVQHVELNRADLINRYRQSLQENLFTNQAEVRPRDLARIAAEEVDFLVHSLSHPLESGMQRGAQLCQAGLGVQSVLALSWVIHQFIPPIFEGDQIPHALEFVDLYQNGVVRGFTKKREELILAEQERIRGALQTAVGHYTVEIKEVQSMARKAIEANEFKSHFIARISHELRTPLGALMGIAEMLQQTVYGPLSDAQQDIVQRILNNAHTLKQVFSDFLDQSQIESGQMSLRHKPFSPQELVKRVHSSYLAMALQKGLSMSVEIDPKLPETLMGDEGRIEQILTNLVVNAIKFTKTGGVSIHTFVQENENWAIQVKDTGIGISQENWDHIFEPFRQVEETANRNYGGVGLGLSIVQQLVKAMDGSITLESKVRQGSVFTVVIPFGARTDRRVLDLERKSY